MHKCKCGCGLLTNFTYVRNHHPRKPHSEETKRKISLANKGHKGRIPWNKGKKMGPVSDETKKKLSIIHLELNRNEVWKRNRLDNSRRSRRTKNSREKSSRASTRIWAERTLEEKCAIIKKFRSRLSPNKLELAVKNLSRGAYFRYVGNGIVWINGKNPDFINRSRKKIIEVNGKYWHQDKKADNERIKIFESAGYDVLSISEDEIKKFPYAVRISILLFAVGLK